MEKHLTLWGFGGLFLFDGAEEAGHERASVIAAGMGSYMHVQRASLTIIHSPLGR
jgi:hypothetical protein